MRVSRRARSASFAASPCLNTARIPRRRDAPRSVLLHRRQGTHARREDPGYVIQSCPYITDLPSSGGDGGQAFPTTDCPAGDVALLSNIRAGSYIDAFGIGCSTPSLVSSAASRDRP